MGKLALICGFDGITNYDSMGQLFEFIIEDYFSELRKEYDTKVALQIIQDIVTRQKHFLYNNMEG